jgi:phage-related protein
LSDLKTEITNNLPEWLDAGISFVMEMADGILSGLPDIISVAGDLLDGFINFILDNLDVILEKGIDLVLKLTEGIISALPKIAESAGKVISKLLTSISGKLPDILRMGITLIGKLIAGLVKQAPELLKSFGEILKSLWDAVTSIDWLQLGKDILAGIGKGLKEGLGSVLEAAKEAGQSIKNKFKEFFGIESPSKVMRDEVGFYLSAGIAEGIDDGKDKIERTLRGISTEISTGFDARLAIAGDVPMGASSYVFNNNITVDGAQDPEAWTQGFLRTLKREARMTNGI